MALATATDFVSTNQEWLATEALVATVLGGKETTGLPDGSFGKGPIARLVLIGESPDLRIATAMVPSVRPSGCRAAKAHGGDSNRRSDRPRPIRMPERDGGVLCAVRRRRREEAQHPASRLALHADDDEENGPNAAGGPFTSWISRRRVALRPTDSCGMRLTGRQTARTHCPWLGTPSWSCALLPTRP